MTASGSKTPNGKAGLAGAFDLPPSTTAQMPQSTAHLLLIADQLLFVALSLRLWLGHPVTLHLSPNKLTSAERPNSHTTLHST